MKTFATISLGAVLADLGCTILLAAGIPEPSVVLYGEVRDNITGARITSGTLTWTWQPAVGGDPVMVTTTLTNLNDQFSFVVQVPCESEISGQSVSPHTLKLVNPNAAYRRDIVTWNGQPLVLKDPAQHSFTLSPASRGRLERLDLGLGAFPLDSDGDGLPDWWEALYPSAGNPSDDADGDGLTNGEEYLAGTNPTDPASSFRFVHVTADVQGEYLIEWSSVPDKSYSVLRSRVLSTNPGDYQVIRSGILSAGARTGYRDLPPSGHWFYRVSVAE